MPISSEQIKQYEEWIAKGKIRDLFDDLLDRRNDTKYKSEIIILANKMKDLDKQKISGAISYNDYMTEQGKINNSVLLLLDYIKKEKPGHDKAKIPGISSEKGAETVLSFSEVCRLWFRKNFPWILSALLSGLLVGYVMLQNYDVESSINCNDGGFNLNGQWNIRWLGEKNLDKELVLGEARFKQDSCFKSFKLNCQFDLNQDSSYFFTFNSKIGGYHEGEIYFVYENSLGEKGVCSGELLDNYKSEFFVKCVDLAVGADPSNGSTGIIYFSKTKFTHSH